MNPFGPAAIPHFAIELSPPDISPWMAGNTGVPGFSSFAGAAPGPHVAAVALMHGNEIGGALVLDALLREGVWPERGRLTLGFLNIEAYARFDPRQPTASRFLDEDMNRIWDPAVLEGPRRSRELARAREVWPLLAEADFLLDLHSMLWPSDPLMLCGPGARGRELAVALGTPELVVADRGHQTGPRLIDHPRFTGEGGTAAAVLLEAGQHWLAETPRLMRRAVEALMRHAGLAGPPLPPSAARCAEVTVAVTAATSAFGFVRPFRGGDVVPRRNTLIAMDGDNEVRTPHDDCLLVMPSLRASRGHTAVRLARFV